MTGRAQQRRREEFFRKKGAAAAMENLNNFGLRRVAEPRAATPVTAWKIDNSREITPEECRFSVKYIHLERDNFQQLCSECGYDETKIKAKILDLVQRRGKLHNPITQSAGQFYGVIEEMGSEYRKLSPYRPGQELFCITTLSGIPLHIDAIHSINYHYGILTVSGYAIVFTGSPLLFPPAGLDLRYTLAAFDEAGSLMSVGRRAADVSRALIIGKDLLSSVLYAAVIRRSAGSQCRITAVLDEEEAGVLPLASVKEELSLWADQVFILDVSRPEAAVRLISETDPEPYDLTVNCQDLMGAEALCVLLTRSGGRLYYTSLKNSYIQSTLLAECMGKQLESYSLGPYSADYDTFTIELLRSIRPGLERVNRLYETPPHPPQSSGRFKATAAYKAGQTAGFIFGSPVSEALVNEALNVAGYDCSVILQGETGTGKEKVLELIHRNSGRRGKACVKINCATIQENLAESEFFGYEAGSFTGAQATGKKGYFELANGGILFLDEVGCLSLNLQSKLLRVLQEGQFYKVGGTVPVNVNVRVICANNVPLRQLVEEGKFREDLYYRLNICTINVPPLRERREDVSALALAFLEQYCKSYGADKRLDEGALSVLAGHHWPGNVRELENLIHRAVINIKGHIITAGDISGLLNASVCEDLVLDLQQRLRGSSALDFNEIVSQQEIRLIEYALKKCGSTRKAAAFLHMTQQQLMRKKQKYGL
ncbi:MAG: sigma-54 dependent transcriptional regulator [Bacillota bacterium]|nr:sigma-54 dependent transcriptional regulator [Bacillota bacterium]